MSKDKVVYLIGAGASIGSFPIVKPTKAWEDRGLAECLIDFSDETKRLTMNLYHSDPIQKTVDLLVTSLRTTGEAAREFGNVDSYAKYLFHTSQKKLLDNLKIALTYFFINKQFFQDERKKEKRYLNFLTSLIDENHSFPNHVSILSWNYDFLLQTAATKYRQEEFSVSDGASYHSPSFINYFPSPGYAFYKTHKDFVEEPCSLVHLNGIAGFYVDKPESASPIFQSIFNDLKLKYGDKKISPLDLVGCFHEKYVQNAHLITFAWEKYSETHRFLTNKNGYIEKLVKDATILVVIGYSFPFYNREIDNKIFEVLKPTLRKIYFQDPSINGDFLRKLYDLPDQDIIPSEGIFSGMVIRSAVEIEHITYTDQFYIPVEV